MYRCMRRTVRRINGSVGTLSIYFIPSMMQEYRKIWDILASPFLVSLSVLLLTDYSTNFQSKHIFIKNIEMLIVRYKNMRDIINFPIHLKQKERCYLDKIFWNLIIKICDIKYIGKLRYMIKFSLHISANCKKRTRKIIGKVLSILLSIIRDSF